MTAGPTYSVNDHFRDKDKSLLTNSRASASNRVSSFHQGAIITNSKSNPWVISMPSSKTGFKKHTT